MFKNIIIVVLLLVGFIFAWTTIYQRETKIGALKEIAQLQDKLSVVEANYVPQNLQSTRDVTLGGEGFGYFVKITSLLQNEYDNYILKNLGSIGGNPQFLESFNQQQNLFEKICPNQKFAKEKYEIKQVGNNFFVELSGKKYQIRESGYGSINYEKFFKEDILLDLMKQHPNANPEQIKQEINRQNLTESEDINQIKMQGNCFVLEEIK